MGRTYKDHNGDVWEEQPDGKWKKKFSIRREMKKIEKSFKEFDKRFK